MNEIIFLIKEADEGGYIANSIGFDIFTEADTIVELKQMIKDAVNCHFEQCNKPSLIRLHFIKDEVLVV